MHVVVEYSRPVRGDDRFHCPGVPPKDKVPPEGYTYPPVPDILYPVMLHTEDGSLRIGMVGSYLVGAEHRWAWYYLHRDQRTFKRDRPTVVSAAKWILQEFVDDFTRRRGLAKAELCSSAHIYPAPQHVVIALQYSGGRIGPPSLAGAGICKILDATFPEFTF